MKSTHSDAFQTLMQCIQQSVLVQDETLLQSPDIVRKSQDLKQALDKGDATHVIFADDECQLCLIYLLKENLLTEDQFTTAYLYLTALMQFSEKQLIHPDHISTRRLWGDVIVFSADDEAVLADYAEKLSKSAGLPNLLTAKSIITYYSSLANTEKWLIAIPSAEYADESDDVKLINIPKNLDAQPMLQRFTYENNEYYLFPSTSFTKWVLKKMNPERQMGIAPCFGRISPERLYKEFHSKNKHPVSLHSAFIKSNPLLIHNVKLGPLYNALHDLYFHCFAGTAFKSNEFNFIINVLYPSLQKISAASSDVSLQTMIKELSEVLIDLGVDFSKFIEHGTIFKDYLKRVFNVVCSDQASIKCYYILLLELCRMLAAQANSIQEKYAIEPLELLKEVLSFNFINQIEFHPGKSRIAAKTKINLLLDSLVFTNLAYEEMQDQLTRQLINDPEACIQINRAGYLFLPPLFPLADTLLTEILQSRSKITFIDGPATLFNSSSPAAEADDKLLEIKKPKSSG